MTRSDYGRIRRYLIEKYSDKTQWYALLAIIVGITLPWLFSDWRASVKVHPVGGILLYVILVVFIILFIIGLEFYSIDRLVERKLTEKYAERYRNQFKLTM